MNATGHNNIDQQVSCQASHKPTYLPKSTGFRTRVQQNQSIQKQPVYPYNKPNQYPLSTGACLMFNDVLLSKFHHSPLIIILSNLPSTQAEQSRWNKKVKSKWYMWNLETGGAGAHPALDGGPTWRAFLHPLLLMEVAAFGTDDLVGTREEHHGHLLTQAHDTLPVALYIIKIEILGYCYVGQNLGIAVLSPFRKMQCIGLIVSSPLGGSNLWRVQGHLQLCNMLLKSTDLTLVSLCVIRCFKMQQILFWPHGGLNLLPLFPLWGYKGNCLNLSSLLLFPPCLQVFEIIEKNKDVNMWWYIVKAGYKVNRWGWGNRIKPN